jgi:hypothetical protein
VNDANFERMIGINSWSICANWLKGDPEIASRPISLTRELIEIAEKKLQPEALSSNRESASGRGRR